MKNLNVTLIYVLISNEEVESSDEKNRDGKIEVCPHCLQKLTTQEKIDMHKIDCINHTAVRIEFTDIEK